jgi:hypothetical protein
LSKIGDGGQIIDGCEVKAIGRRNASPLTINDVIAEINKPVIVRCGVKGISAVIVIG